MKSSAGHLTGSHKVRSLQKASGIAGKETLSKPAYSTNAVPQPAPPSASGISPLGTKALGLRAKKVLEPLSNPNESLT